METEKSNSQSIDRQNVSFKFTKTTSKALTGNRLAETSSEQKDYVLSVDKSEIKSTIQRLKPKELVIPLIKKNNWRTSDDSQNGTVKEDDKIQELAIQEILKESSEKNAQWEKRESKDIVVTIPLIMQNKVPAGYETDEKMDVSLRPDESNLDDYEKVPIEQYGLAMLKGMGWKEGEGIGANNKKCVAPIQVELRPKGLGLGADASVLKKSQQKAKEEKLELVKGAYVQIIQGPHKGYYGQIMGLDEENARAIVKLSNDEKVKTFPEFFFNLVSKKEYDKESRIINRASYEQYKQEKEKIKQETTEKQSCQLQDSKNGKKQVYDSSEKDTLKSKNHSKKRKHSSERSEENHSSSKSKHSKLWVRPQLRVRFIDEKYKKGRYFNKKLIVVDVLSRNCCSCKTEDHRTLLDDISPSMLETVIPRDESSYVMIVQGKYKGELCTILKRDKSKCIATVQFLSDRSQALKIEYDSICEYVGDVSQFD